MEITYKCIKTEILFSKQNVLFSVNLFLAQLLQLVHKQTHKPQSIFIKKHQWHNICIYLTHTLTHTHTNIHELFIFKNHLRFKSFPQRESIWSCYVVYSHKLIQTAVIRALSHSYIHCNMKSADTLRQIQPTNCWKNFRWKAAWKEVEKKKAVKISKSQMISCGVECFGTALPQHGRVFVRTCL